MNKVVSIELARQMFWIDESAYEVLQKYLQKIQHQLQGDECALDIYNDIELRIAELLFEQSHNSKRAISTIQLNEVIEQVGFLDSEDNNEPQPKKSYRDQHNKILAGVCAGLSTRFKVPAFIFRMTFVTLIGLFGLGIVLYFIFWFSLDSNNDRNSLLASQGEAQTARKIAKFKTPKINPLMQLQRMIFLPFSIIGFLISMIGKHFKIRKKNYVFLGKCLLSFALVIAILIFSSLLIEFETSQRFSRPITWLITASAMYLAILGVVLYLKKFYLTKPDSQLNNKDQKYQKLKLTALAPIAIIVGAIWYIDNTQSEYQIKTINKTFSLSENELELLFDETYDADEFTKRVRYKVITNDDNNNQVKVHISFSAYGANIDDAINNIRAINYLYTFDNQSLKLNSYWQLQPNTLNRAQNVSVTIEIPQNIVINSTRKLKLKSDIKNSERSPYLALKANSKTTLDDNFKYISNSFYLHEANEQVKNKLSENEKKVLDEKFCNEFFIDESWGCQNNIQVSVVNNERFDHAFYKDRVIINKMREYLQPNRSFFVSNLYEINTLINDLSIKQSKVSDLQQYIEYLIDIKQSPRST